MLDENQQRDICAILTVGGTRRMAAEYAGCHIEAIRRTALADRDFALRIRKAEVGPEITLLRNIQVAASDPKQWRAAAWALERLYPDRYARRPPDAIGPEQLEEIIRQLGQIVVGEVPVKRFRERVLARLVELTADAPSPRRKTKGRK